MTKIFHVIGARRNFIKVAPVVGAIAERDGFLQKIIHTGQHYETNMSDILAPRARIAILDGNNRTAAGLLAAASLSERCGV
ncbi:MAG: hypothetical protein ABSB32_18245 [Thermodesulfobacteriota bacterium]|jgi:UDP-N-acetylglucosamine 2-epimerase (non-hydrolysing)